VALDLSGLHLCDFLVGLKVTAQVAPSVERSILESEASMAQTSFSVKVLTWEGYGTVERASVMKDELLAAFDAATQVVVSLSMLDSIDVSIVQLLIAAKKEANKRGKRFRLTGAIRESVASTLSSVGLPSSPDAGDLEAELFGLVEAGGAVE